VHELVNAISRIRPEALADRAAVHEALRTALIVLSPIAPHVCQKLWEVLGEPGLLVGARWPDVDPTALVQDAIEWVLQVNGKVRGRVVLPADADEAAARAAALGNENVQRFLEGKSVRKVVLVPGKLVNVVVG
jgi:leucyl-tRNA synthetase